MADRTAPVIKLTLTLTGYNLAKNRHFPLNGPIMRQNEAYQDIFCTLKTTSGFNSDHTIRQYTHGLLLESSLYHLVPIGAVRAKIRQSGRLGGCRGETGSKNMAATQKIKILTLVFYSLLQTVFFS